MKKIFLALGVACLLGLASCGNEVDNKIDKLNSLSEELVELQQKYEDGDEEAGKEMEKIAQEAVVIVTELSQAELTEDQQEALKEILAK